MFLQQVKTEGNEEHATAKKVLGWLGFVAFLRTLPWLAHQIQSNL